MSFIFLFSVLPGSGWGWGLSFTPEGIFFQFMITIFQSISHRVGYDHNLMLRCYTKEVTNILYWKPTRQQSFITWCQKFYMSTCYCLDGTLSENLKC